MEVIPLWIDTDISASLMLLYMALRANCLEKSLREEHRVLSSPSGPGQAAQLQGIHGIFSAEGKAISLLLIRILFKTLKMQPAGGEDWLTTGNSSEKQPFLLQVKTVILNLVFCKNQTLFRHVGETFIKDGYILLNWPAYRSRTFLHASSPMKAAFHPSGPSKMLSATPSFYFIPLPLMRHKLYRHMPVYQTTLQDRL